MLQSCYVGTIIILTYAYEKSLGPDADCSIHGGGGGGGGGGETLLFIQ